MVEQATHYCTICAARWKQWPDETWTLLSEDCGPCCNNAPMGYQILKFDEAGMIDGREMDAAKRRYWKEFNARPEPKPALTMVEQVDREAAVDAVAAIVSEGFVVGCCIMSETDGHEFSAYLTEAFAAHRIAAEARGMEKASAIITQQMDERLDADLGWLCLKRVREAISNARAALNGGQHG